MNTTQVCTMRVRLLRPENNLRRLKPSANTIGASAGDFVDVTWSVRGMAARNDPWAEAAGQQAKQTTARSNKRRKQRCIMVRVVGLATLAKQFGQGSPLAEPSLAEVKPLPSGRGSLDIT
jgi:hypothetical protein